MVDESAGGTSSSEEDRDVMRDNKLRKWGKYTIAISIFLGLFGGYWIESFPDVIADEFDSSMSDYQEACEEAIQSDPQWYDQNGCEEHMDRTDAPVLFCMCGLFGPFIGWAMLSGKWNLRTELKGYWDGSKVISTGPFGQAKIQKGISYSGSTTNSTSGYLPSAPEHQKKSFNEKMIEMRLEKARDMASRGLFIEAAYEAEMAGDSELASEYRNSTGGTTKLDDSKEAKQNEERYLAYLTAAVADGVLSPKEEELLREKREEYGISKSRSNEMLEEMGFDAIGEGMLDYTKFTKSRKLRAEGGMAEVYLAKDKGSGRQVIWKQAAPSRMLTTEDANKALENEIEALERLDHPRIPAYIDSGFTVNEEGDRVLVLIMEHIEGGSLDDEMKLLIKMGSRQPLERALKIVVECCDALDYMADLDPPLYHRDIKPHNIIIESVRGAILIDFGLAKEVAAGSGKSLSAGAHTAGWSPPERERGETGATTDVYSLGQLLWHMLTNEGAGIFSESHKSERISELGHPEWLVEVVNKTTVPDDPRKRIQSVAALRYMLENEGELP